MTEPIEVLTVGHSTLPYERFLDLLRSAKVTAIADVRSAPYSRHFPHFNREVLKEELHYDHIAYVFLGNQLGGRPKDKGLFRHGIADYEKMALTAEFSKGLERIIEGAQKYRIAMMCSEHDPMDCHRCLLVGRALHERGVKVKHVLGSGAIIDHSEIELRLLELSGKEDDDLFQPQEHRLDEAYRSRAMKVAYSDNKPDSYDTVAAE